MKKLLFLLLAILSLTTKGQDLKDRIYTKEGDSIICQITEVKENWIYYDHNGKKGLKNDYIHKDDIKSYKQGGVVKQANGGTQNAEQAGFKWEKIDSVTKTKGQLYLDTKMFIAENWKSSKAVIQNDDKENGAIFIVGSIAKVGGSGVRMATFTYSYSVKFYFKDQKYKMVIDNVEFSSSDKAGWTADVANEWPGGWKCALTEKPWKELMASLKSDLQGIVDSYDKYIKAKSSSNGEW